MASAGFGYESVFHADSWEDSTHQDRDSLSATSHPDLAPSEVEEGRIEWEGVGPVDSSDMYHDDDTIDGGGYESSSVSSPHGDHQYGMFYDTSESHAHWVQSQESVANEEEIKISLWARNSYTWGGFRVSWGVENLGDFGIEGDRGDVEGYTIRRRSTSSDYSIAVRKGDGDGNQDTLASTSNSFTGWVYVEVVHEGCEIETRFWEGDNSGSPDETLTMTDCSHGADGGMVFGYAGGGTGSDTIISDLRVKTQGTEPDQPTNPDPNDDETTVDLKPDLEVDVSSDDGEVDFVEFEIDGETYTDSDVDSGETASVSSHELDPGETYGWSAEACNDIGCSSDSWSFTTVHEPDSPSNPSPTESDVSLGSDLEVDVSHPDNLDMDATFRINDGSGWSTVDTDSSVSSGDTATVSPDLEYSETYEWYVDVDTQGYSTSTQSDTYSFSTEHDVSAIVSGPERDPSPPNSELEAAVIHSDPERTVQVEFLDEQTGETLYSEDAQDGDTVVYDPEGDDFGSEPDAVYDWSVSISGEEDSENWDSETQSFEVVDEPDPPTIISPEHEEEDVSLDTELEVQPSHPDSEDIDDLEMEVTFWIEYDSGEGYEAAGVDFGEDGEIVSNGNDLDLEYSDDYWWYAEACFEGFCSDSNAVSFDTVHDVDATWISPIDGAVGQSPELTELTAEIEHSDPDREVDGSIEYRLEGDQDWNTANTEADLTDGDWLQAELTDLEGDEEYEWRVTTEGVTDSETIESDIWIFYTDYWAGFAREVDETGKTLMEIVEKEGVTGIVFRLLELLQ